MFITATYVFFAVSLVGFFLLITMAPEAVGEASGRVFYVWFSVFNLFSTMVFWALMADRFTLEQSKRLFGVIAVGGTLGAIAGPWLAERAGGAARDAGAAARRRRRSSCWPSSRRGWWRGCSRNARRKAPMRRRRRRPTIAP